MRILHKNSFGEMQQTSAGFRIVRSGDGCVSHIGSFNFIHKIFNLLGELMKETAKVQRKKKQYTGGEYINGFWFE
jgi:hypothetical protein